MRNLIKDKLHQHKIMKNDEMSFRFKSLLIVSSFSLIRRYEKLIAYIILELKKIYIHTPKLFK